MQDENGMIKEEYQKNILTEFQHLIEELDSSLHVGMFGVSENSYSEKLKKLYIYYYILDEKIFTLLSEKMKVNQNWKLEAQFRLYMMYLKTYRETLFLLSGGFSDCALSRTRRLFEIGVYLGIINKNDEKLAERYCKHCNTQRYDLALKLNNNDTVKKIIKQVKNLNYEKEFINNNGLANTIIKDKRTIYFSDLIELTEYKKHEFIYKYSCLYVHPSLHSSLNSLELTQETKGKNVWNTSPSLEGIEEVIDVLLVYLGVFTEDYINSFDIDGIFEFLVLSTIASDNFWDEMNTNNEESPKEKLEVK